MDEKEFAAAWRDLPGAERRKILKATRGSTPEDTQTALLVNAYAKKQLRLWWRPILIAVIMIAVWIPVSKELIIPTMPGIMGAVVGCAVLMYTQRLQYLSAVARSEEVLSGGRKKKPSKK